MNYLIAFLNYMLVAAGVAATWVFFLVLVSANRRKKK